MLILLYFLFILLFNNKNIQILCAKMEIYNFPSYFPLNENLISCASDVGMRATSNEVGIPVELNITFRLSRTLHYYEELIFELPRMTRSVTFSGKSRDVNFASESLGLIDRAQVGTNVSWGNVMITPSNNWEASWVEGNPNDIVEPYSGSAFMLRISPIAKEFVQLLPGAYVTIQVLASNLINAFCGSASSDVYYDPKELFYDAPLPRLRSRVLNQNLQWVYSNESVIFSTFSEFINKGKHISTNLDTSINGSNIHLASSIVPRLEMMSGCKELSDCSGHGRCDYCKQKCMCVDGYGGPNDAPGARDPTCAKR
jgi:hypothetical protein